MKYTLTHFVLLYVTTLFAGGPGEDPNSIGYKFITEGKHDSAMVYFSEKANYYLSVDSSICALDVYNRAGVVATRMDHYDLALSFLDSSSVIAERTGNTHSIQMSNTLISLGVIYRAQGDYKTALTFHFKALKLRQELLGEFSKETATSYGNIGNTYFSNQQYDSALYYHEKAMIIRDSLFGETSAEIIESYRGMGNACRELKQYDDAIIYFEAAVKAKQLQRGENHPELIPYYENLALIYKKKGDKKTSKEYSKKAREINKSNSN